MICIMRKSCTVNLLLSSYHKLFLPRLAMSLYNVGHSQLFHGFSIMCACVCVCALFINRKPPKLNNDRQMDQKRFLLLQSKHFAFLALQVMFVVVQRFPYGSVVEVRVSTSACMLINIGSFVNLMNNLVSLRSTSDGDCIGDFLWKMSQFAIFLNL